MTLVLGETQSETFYVGATGMTFTRTASYIAGVATVWSPSFTEVGSGFYRYAYTPLVAGSFEWVGTATDTTPVTINFDVDATGETIVVGVTGSAGVTRTQLRRRISRDLSNMLPVLTATSNGTTTTLIDAKNLKLNDDSLVGRQVYFVSGANSATTQYVSANSYSAGSITFPTVNSTLIGDVAEIHNVRGGGWTVEEIHDELDGVLRDASDSLPAYDREDIAGTFDADSPTVTIPATFRAIYRVDWLGADGFYHSIPATTDAGDPGWWVNRGENELIVNGDWRTQADGDAIRLYGQKVYAALTSDASTTTANEEWLVAQVVANLLMQGAERVGDNSRLTKSDWWQKKADRLRDMLVPLPPPDRVLV